MKDFSKTISITDDSWITRAPSINTIDASSIILDTGDEKQKALVDYLSAIELFRTQQNSAAGLMAFANSYKAGIYPPEDLLRWLSDSFSEWIEVQHKNDPKDRKDLEKILSLRKQVSGSTRSFVTVIKHQRNVEIAIELHHLVFTFGISQNKAAEMIARRMESVKDPNAISEGTIIKKILPLMRQLHREHRFLTSIFNEEQTKKFLDKYPSEYKLNTKIQKAIRELKK